MPDDITLEFHTPTPILATLLDETDPESEPRRIFGLGHRSDFGPSPAVAELLGPRSRRDVHRPEFAPNWRPPTLIKPWNRRPEPTEVHAGDPAAAPALGPDDTTPLALPNPAARLRAFAAARFAHQPLGPGAPRIEG